MDSGSAASASPSPAASRPGSSSSSSCSNGGSDMAEYGSNGYGPPVEHTYTPKNILVTGGAGFM